MRNWKARLRRIIESKRTGQAGDDVRERRQELADFLENTVMPAFQALKAELERHGREVETYKTEREAAITVYKDGVEEFSYAIRGHVYHGTTFAWPAFDPKSEGPKICAAVVSLHDQPQSERSIQDLTRERIIQEFLEEYERFCLPP